MVLLELAGIGFVFILILAWIIAAIPFWLGLRLLGVKESLLSVALIAFIGAFLQAIVKFTISGMYGLAIGGLAAYLAWVFLIKFYFDLSFLRSVLATILPALILAAILLLGLLL